jgi:sugar fermentation stimulation protein A
VDLGGVEVRAHLANPGRLTGTLADGCALLLDGPFPGRSCPWTVVAAREGRTWVGTVTTLPNQVFPVLLAGGLFPEIGRGGVRREVTHGRSRFDFAVGDVLVEVKSVTLARGRRALFPDAVTERGRRHVLELREHVAGGGKGALVFVAQRGDVAEVAPEDEVDPAFGEALRSAAGAGVRVLACALELGPRGPMEARRIPVRLGRDVRP